MVVGRCPRSENIPTHKWLKKNFALLYLHIQYCITSWGCVAKSVLDPLIKLQKLMVRVMTCSHHKVSSMPLFRK